MLAITPEAFQAAALAWITALSIVLTAMTVALAKLWPLIQQFKGISQRQDDQSRRISSVANTVTTVALAVNPPGTTTTKDTPVP